MLGFKSSRIDMNTCQISIKSDILLKYFGNPYPGYQILEITTVVHLPS